MYQQHKRRLVSHGSKSGIRLSIIARNDAKRLEFKRYFTGELCREGHLAERQTSTGHCVVCNLARVKANYDPVAKAIYRKRYYAKHVEEARARCRDWHARNKHIRNPKKLKYMHENRERWNSNEKMRRARDPQFRFERLIRTKTMKAIERNQRTGTAIDALGCSVVLLKKYIAKQFKRGMSWNNWKTVWELDHIRRLSAFDLLNPKQYAKACHYTNLQPLFIAEHRKKSASERAVTF